MLVLLWKILQELAYFLIMELRQHHHHVIPAKLRLFMTLSSHIHILTILAWHRGCVLIIVLAFTGPSSPPNFLI